MLLLISAAGWWKFHHDLYVEEAEVLKRLRGSSVRIDLRRADSSSWFSPPDDPDSIPWNAALIAPLEGLHIYGELSQEQRDLARTLPRLKHLTEQSSPEMELAEVLEIRRRQLPAPYDVESLLGSELPSLNEPTLGFHLLDVPIPSGVPVEEAEAERIADAIRLAWRNLAARAREFLVYAQSDDGDPSRDTPKDERQLIYWSDARVLRHHANDDREDAEMLDVVSDGRGFRYRGRGDLLKRQGRFLGYADEDYFRRDFLRFPYDEFPYHGLGENNFWLVQRTFEAMPRFEFDRIEKIDDARYRVDFSPFKATPMIGDRSVSPSAIDRWECVLRSDLGWAPEEVSWFENDPRYPLDRRLVQRFRRQDGMVLIEERLVRDQVGAGYPQRTRTRYAWDLDPKIVDRAFDPAAVDPNLWLEPRPLRIERWYLVTLLLGCGLAVMLIGRRFIQNRSRAGASDELRETEGGVTNET